MRAKLNCRRKTVIKGNYVIGIILMLIIFLTIFGVYNFNTKITPNLINIARASVNEFNETIITDYTVKNLYNEIATLDEVIKITQNSREEIISVDFNLENVYKALSIITNYIKESVESESLRQKVFSYYNGWLSSDLKAIVLSLPMGAVSKNIFVTNLGPRLPVKINYIGYIGSSIRLKVEDYGINNALVSIYIDCSITNEFIIPVLNNKVTNQYSILVASKIIQGSIPKYYGGAIETKSNILNIPIS